MPASQTELKFPLGMFQNRKEHAPWNIDFFFLFFWGGVFVFLCNITIFSQSFPSFFIQNSESTTVPNIWKIWMHGSPVSILFPASTVGFWQHIGVTCILDNWYFCITKLSTVTHMLLRGTPVSRKATLEERTFNLHRKLPVMLRHVTKSTEKNFCFMHAVVCFSEWECSDLPLIQWEKAGVRPLKELLSIWICITGSTLRSIHPSIHLPLLYPLTGSRGGYSWAWPGCIWV